MFGAGWYGLWCVYGGRVGSACDVEADHVFNFVGRDVGGCVVRVGDGEVVWDLVFFISGLDFYVCLFDGLFDVIGGFYFV